MPSNQTGLKHAWVPGDKIGQSIRKDLATWLALITVHLPLTVMGQIHMYDSCVISLIWSI